MKSVLTRCQTVCNNSISEVSECDSREVSEGAKKNVSLVSQEVSAGTSDSVCKKSLNRYVDGIEESCVRLHS